MTDITKCLGNKDCPRKEKCYRFTAESEPLYQSYFCFTPLNRKTGKCKEFLSINIPDNQKKEDK